MIAMKLLGLTSMMLISIGFLGIFAMTRRISISFQGVDTTNIQWNIRLEHPPTVDDTGGESCWFHIVLLDMIINCHIGLSWVISVAIYILYIWLGGDWNHGISWLSHHIGNFMIPTDEVIFFRGVGSTTKPAFHGHIMLTHHFAVFFSYHCLKNWVIIPRFQINLEATYP